MKVEVDFEAGEKVRYKGDTEVMEVLSGGSRLTLRRPTGAILEVNPADVEIAVVSKEEIRKKIKNY